MPTLHLSSPRPSDAGDLLAFELQNRDFFEAHINARPAGYYSAEGVRSAIETAEREAGDDKAYQYLVRNAAGILVGRVNLTRIRREHFHCAELGYRIAQSETGNGYAGEAVRQLLAKAFTEHRLVRVEATTRAENVGSIQVLLRNAFTQFGRSTRSFQLAGAWYDLLYFEKRADA